MNDSIAVQELKGLEALQISLIQRNEYKISLINKYISYCHVFSNRLQMMPDGGKNKKVAHKAQLSVLLMFSTNICVFCNLLLSRHRAT